MSDYDSFAEDEDFSLPNPPAKAQPRELDEVISPDNQFKIEELPITKELGTLSLEDQYDTALLQNEMAHMDMYLNNIHTGFKYVTSVNSLLKLVGAGAALVKTRRDLYERARASKAPTSSEPIEYDVMGNPIIKKR